MYIHNILLNYNYVILNIIAYHRVDTFVLVVFAVGSLLQLALVTTNPRLPYPALFLLIFLNLHARHNSFHLPPLTPFIAPLLLIIHHCILLHQGRRNVAYSLPACCPLLPNVLHLSTTPSSSSLWSRPILSEGHHPLIQCFLDIKYDVCYYSQIVST